MPQTTELLDLQRALSADPGNAKLLYLLGAELAENGRYDDAITALTSAVAIDPELHTARFQLGLLHLTMAQPEQSLAVLAALEALPDDNALKHFKRGLQALATDDFEECIDAIRRGIALNTSNPALNKDMAMIVERINEARGEPPPSARLLPAEPAKRPPGEASGKVTDFRLYKDIQDT